MRTGIIRHRENRMQTVRSWITADAAPKGALALESGAEQIVLAPPEQRRDEQTGEIEIVEGLNGETGCGEKILHGQRRGQKQSVNAGDGHAFRVETGHNQGGKIPAPP